MTSITRSGWHVRSRETGDELAWFTGSHDSDSEGSRRSGTRSVTIDEAALTVTAPQAEGETKVLELPSAIEFLDEGKRIRLTYRDGRTEDRERSAVYIPTKYGDGTHMALKKDPAKRK